jgi:diguanylate cyclase (GGDEF)-like protein
VLTVSRSIWGLRLRPVWLWVDGTIHNHLGQADRDEVLVELIDVSEAMAVKEALESKELLLNRLTEALPVGVLQIDGSRNVLYSNERLHQILGAPATGDLRDLFSGVDDVDRESLDRLLSAALRSGADGDLDIGLSSGTGELRRCLMSVRTLTTKTSVAAGALVCVSDTTDSVRMRRQLENRATFDLLTRCHNRASVMSALNEALAGEGAEGTGAIFIDLDRFKPVNDQFGHAAGDELLAAVAGRIRACLRDGDCLGRIGGDEFLIVCQGIAESDELLLVARRICDSVQSGFDVGAHAIEVGLSIGLALYAPGITADDLVAVAEDAMYESKRQGRSVPVLGRLRMGGARHGEAFAEPRFGGESHVRRPELCR